MDKNFQKEIMLSRLYELPPVCEGYTLSQAFYTAMTMDHRYWQILLTLQAGAQRVQEWDLTDQLCRTWFLVGQPPHGLVKPGSGTAELRRGNLYQHVRFYEGDAPCFHAKMAFLRYTHDGEASPDYYRIGVFSKNLEMGDTFQNVCVLDGFALEAPTENGKALWSYLEHCGQNYRETTPGQDMDLYNHISNFQSICRLRLPEDCRVYFGGISKAPRLGDMLFSEPLPKSAAEPVVHCVTRSSFIKEYCDYAVCRKPALEVWNCLNQKTGKDPTHMKLYWKKNGENLWDFWSGSANCSVPALGKTPEGDAVPKVNVECLVQVKDLSETEKESIIAALVKTKPKHKIMKKCPAQTEETEQQESEELRILRKIEKEHSFRYDPEKKRLKVSCQDEELDGEKVWSYRRPNTQTEWFWTVTPVTAFDKKGTYEDNHRRGRGWWRASDGALISLWREVNEKKKLLDAIYVEPEGRTWKSLEDHLKNLQSQRVRDLLDQPLVTAVMEAPDRETRQAELETLEAQLQKIKALEGHELWHNQIEALQKFAELMREGEMQDGR